MTTKPRTRLAWIWQWHFLHIRFNSYNAMTWSFVKNGRDMHYGKRGFIREMNTFNNFLWVNYKWHEWHLGEFLFCWSHVNIKFLNSTHDVWNINCPEWQVKSKRSTVLSVLIRDNQPYLCNICLGTSFIKIYQEGI